jgi:endonuclease/exonuclease/phosphatase family metal-dependent hydrolase
VKVVTYNIQYGLGKDKRYDLARIAREIEDTDVIALQEVERHWRRSGCVDSAAVLGTRLPEHHWVYGANLDMDASYRDAEGRLVNRRRQFGTMILSRLPIVSVANSQYEGIRLCGAVLPALVVMVRFAPCANSSSSPSTCWSPW